jgi:hypothetical protein
MGANIHVKVSVVSQGRSLDEKLAANQSVKGLRGRGILHVQVPWKESRRHGPHLEIFTFFKSDTALCQANEQR